jgi:hypothetical protein
MHVCACGTVAWMDGDGPWDGPRRKTANTEHTVYSTVYSCILASVDARPFRPDAGRIPTEGRTHGIEHDDGGRPSDQGAEHCPRTAS